MKEDIRLLLSRGMKEFLLREKKKQDEGEVNPANPDNWNPGIGH